MEATQVLLAFPPHARTPRLQPPWLVRARCTPGSRRASGLHTRGSRGGVAFVLAHLSILRQWRRELPADCTEPELRARQQGSQAGWSIWTASGLFSARTCVLLMPVVWPLESWHAEEELGVRKEVLDQQHLARHLRPQLALRGRASGGGGLGCHHRQGCAAGAAPCCSSGCLGCCNRERWRADAHAQASRGLQAQREACGGHLAALSNKIKP